MMHSTSPQMQLTDMLHRLIHTALRPDSYIASHDYSNADLPDQVLDFCKKHQISLVQTLQKMEETNADLRRLKINYYEEVERQYPAYSGPSVCVTADSFFDYIKKEVKVGAAKVALFDAYMTFHQPERDLQKVLDSIQKAQIFASETTHSIDTIYNFLTSDPYYKGTLNYLSEKRAPSILKHNIESRMVRPPSREGSKPGTTDSPKGMR